MTQEQKEFILTLFSDASQRDASQRHIQKAPSTKVVSKLNVLLDKIESSSWGGNFEKFFDAEKDKKLLWFVHLMVFERVSFMGSHRDSYLRFLERVGSDTLYEEVILATCESCKVILLSTARNPSEESWLTAVKSLGHWFGKVTIARKRHIQDSELDLKYLILEAYKNGLMTMTIPFIAEVLEPCRNNHTYQLPNPWVMDILDLLSGIYSMPDLQTSLLLTIEGLFEIFWVMGPVNPRESLKELSKKEDGNPDFIDKQRSITGEAHGQHQSPYTVRIMDVVVINTRLHPRLSSNLVSVLKLAVSKAIEIAVPDAVKMSAAIALQSTKAHILMAYPSGTSDDSDDIMKGMRYNAANSMVTSLVQKYAKKMCKEPLRGWMYNLLLNSCEHTRIPYLERRSIVNSIISDNLKPIYRKVQEIASKEVGVNFPAQVESWYSRKDEKSIIKTIVEKLKAGMSASEMKDVLASHFWLVGDKYEALFGAIFSGVEEGFAEVLEEKKSYFTAISEPMSQFFLLQAIDNYSRKGASASFKKEFTSVIECLIAAPTLVSGSDFVFFFERKDQDSKASKSFRKSVKKVVDRLEGVAVQTGVTFIV